MLRLSIEQFRDFVDGKDDQLFIKRFDEYLDQFTKVKTIVDKEKVRLCNKKTRTNKGIYNKNTYKIYKDQKLVKEISGAIKVVQEFVETTYNTKMHYSEVYGLCQRYNVKNLFIREKNRKLYDGLEIEKLKTDY